jgi:hypothetical protein
MLDILVGARVKAIDFFITKLDETPIELSDFHLEDKSTLSALKKAYSEDRKKAKKDHEPLTIERFAEKYEVDPNYPAITLEEDYKLYLGSCREELSETLGYIREEYEIDLGLQSIERKKKYGSNFLIFKLAEEYGEGDTGCVTPYSWHCSIRTGESVILSIASGHIYLANYECTPNISDIFVFEDNYTIDYGRYASAFQQKLEQKQGIGRQSWTNPDISHYLDSGPIVFLKNFYRDQSGNSIAGDGLAVLNFAICSIYKFFQYPMLLVSFVDPPQYTYDDENQPASIRKLQKQDVKTIRNHILGGLSGLSEEIYEFMFIEPSVNPK